MSEQRNKFTMLDTQTEGEAELRKDISSLQVKVVGLEATVRYLLQLSGENPDDFIFEAMDRHMTAGYAKQILTAPSNESEGK